MILVAGATACFLIVYPPVNDAAMSLNYGDDGPTAIGSALIDGSKGFSNLVLYARGVLPQLLLLANCLAFVRRPPALIASLSALLAFKLFFYFVYPSAYRHEAMFVVFLIALHWLSNTDPPVSGPRLLATVEMIGNAAFTLLLVVQSLDLVKPLSREIEGVPYSRSADVARIVRRPALAGAIIMADPDLMVEALPYYVDNPLWLPREEQFGSIFSRSLRGRETLSLEDLLADAKSLRDQYHRPIVILLHTDLGGQLGRPSAFLRNTTEVTPSGVRKFRATTRLIARLRPAITDESYDVYVYRG